MSHLHIHTIDITNVSIKTTNTKTHYRTRTAYYIKYKALGSERTHYRPGRSKLTRARW